MSTLLPDQYKELDYDLCLESETLWKEAATNNNEESVLPLNRSAQASWDQPMYTLKYEQLLSDCLATSSDRARLLAISSEHSSDWLQANPN